MKLSAFLELRLLRLLPKNLVSRWMGWLAGLRLPRRLLAFVIRRFTRAYGIDMAEVATSQFDTFNDFFTRPLRPECRPVDNDAASVVSPVDGVIGMAGDIGGGDLFQCKGIAYSLSRLVVHPAYAEMFSDGHYVTLYLSPRHYHRIHSPLAAAIEELYYIPGTLYPVKPLAIANIPGLFTINERLITLLRHTLAGPVAVIKVGATVVGKIKVVYDKVESNCGRRPIHRCYQGISIAKGGELGRFELGSTVVLLFSKNRVALSLPATGAEVRCGQRIASIVG